MLARLSAFQRALLLPLARTGRVSQVSTDPRGTLRAALDPQSVAIVGVPENPGKAGGPRGHRIDRPGRCSPVCGRDGLRRNRGTLPRMMKKRYCR
jgi:hypothetical protein